MIPRFGSHRLVIAMLGAGAALSLAVAAAPANASSVAVSRPATANQLGLTWKPIPTGSTEDFRGVKAVSRNVVWVAGTNGQVLRTIDAGRTWQDVSPPGAGTIYFRDIEATSARHAVLMSVAGQESDATGQRVYVTDDGGRHWNLALANPVPGIFFDCMAFDTATHGYLVGDPIGGRFQVYVTRDAGHHWQPLDLSGMPVTSADEFGFAAGGTCMSAVGSNVWFGTGGLNQTHVYRTTNRGRTWTATATPIGKGTGFPGIFAAQFRDRRHGFAVGGDLDDIAAAARTAAWSDDGGRSWHQPTSFPGGARTGATWVPNLPVALAVGPTGSDVSVDAGRSWQAIDQGAWNTVSCAGDLACYAVGNAGLVGRLTLTN